MTSRYRPAPAPPQLCALSAIWSLTTPAPLLQAKVLALRQRFKTDSDTTLPHLSEVLDAQEATDPALKKRFTTPIKCGKKLPPPRLPEAVWHELASEMEEVWRHF